MSFLTLVHGLGLSWTFWVYGLVSVGAWLFVRRFVPETKGRSLEQIEKEFAGDRIGVPNSLPPGEAADAPEDTV